MFNTKNTLTKEDLKNAMKVSAVATALLEMPEEMLESLTKDLHTRGVELPPLQVREVIRMLMKWALEDERQKT